MPSSMGETPLAQNVGLVLRPLPSRGGNRHHEEVITVDASHWNETRVNDTRAIIRFLCIIQVVALSFLTASSPMSSDVGVE